MTGFLLIDKPAGVTSHDVVDAIRRATGEKRVGHAGTLDPFATGLLLVGVGREATREFPKLVGLDKAYDGTLVLGAISDTQDGTGKIIPSPLPTPPTLLTLQSALPKFTGPLKQVPPMYSAKKQGGKKLYELARQGIEVERPPVDIVIHALELLSFEPPRATVRVRCSSGTYIRTLAHDIGQFLDCGAYLETLRRTSIGPFDLGEATPLGDITKESVENGLVPIIRLLGRLSGPSAR